jgi:uncharacterized membrane protein YfcA
MLEFLVSFFGGLIAGSINTLAGNGSAIVLIILTDVVGLSPNVANGTNRIGVLIQTVASGYELNKKHNQELRNSKSIIIVTVLGALLGVFIASVISNDQFKQAYKFMMLLMLIVILVKPSRWLKSEKSLPLFPAYISYPVFFLVGVYGGFIQMGVGIFLLAALVLLAGYTIMNSNLVKALIVASYTVVVLIIFQIKGLVDWEAGIVIALSQGLGGWLTAKYANNSVYVEKIAYFLLVLIVVFSVIYQFFFQ